MNLIPFADILQDDGLGIQGQDIFIFMIPMEATRGLLLRNKLRGTHIDYELPGFHKTFFQLIARAPAYQEGEQLIESAIVSLTMMEKQLSGMYVRYCRPKTMPVAFPLSDGNLIEFGVDFEIAFDVTK